ncbi:MAG: YdgA family protein [Desulforhopalus sp.]|nr:YdgA family protein [Desulforhopalus sp.]
MKKIIIGVVVILGIAAVSAPFGSGILMERVVRDTFGNANTMYASSGHDTSIEIVRYDRGFSSSEIEWKVKFGKMKALYGFDEIVFVDRAEHGMGGIVSKTSLEKNPWYTDFISKKLGGKDPLHITTAYKLAGGIESTLANDSFSMPAADGKAVTIKPGKVVVACDKGLKHFTSEASWEGLGLEGQLAVGGVSMKSALTMISPFIWDGNVSMGLKNTQIDDNKGHLDLTNLKIDYVLNYDKDKNTLSAKAEYGVDTVTLGQEKISNIFARIGISGLDAKNYEEFMKTYTSTVSAMMGDIAAAKDDPEKMQQLLDKKMAVVGFQMVALGEKLLTKGLELQISDLRFQAPEGEIKGDVTVSLKKDMTFAQFVPVVSQPSLALDIITLRSNLSLPDKLVGDDPMLFAPIYPGMQTGIFVKNGNMAVHKAETKDGKLFVNDKELVLK